MSYAKEAICLHCSSKIPLMFVSYSDFSKLDKYELEIPAYNQVVYSEILVTQGSMIKESPLGHSLEKDIHGDWKYRCKACVALMKKEKMFCTEIFPCVKHFQCNYFGCTTLVPSQDVLHGIRSCYQHRCDVIVNNAPCNKKVHHATAYGKWYRCEEHYFVPSQTK
jgi:hypothetical protein